MQGMHDGTIIGLDGCHRPSCQTYPVVATFDVLSCFWMSGTRIKISHQRSYTFPDDHFLVANEA
jgi:hypothetical protein